MKKILLSLLIASSITASAAGTDKPTPVVIADETTMVETATTDKLKVVSSNETIANKIIAKFKICGCISYSVRYKKDRMGQYAEYTFRIPAEQKANLLAVVK